MSRCNEPEIQWVGEATTYWRIDEEGIPTDEFDRSDSDFVEYSCIECFEQFSSWEDAKEHLNG